MPLNSSAISASSGSSETGSRTLKSPSLSSRIAASSRRRSLPRTPLLEDPAITSRSAPPLPLPFPFRFPFRPPPLPVGRPFFRREPAAVGERVELSSDSTSSTSILSPISTTSLLMWLLEPAGAGLKNPKSTRAGPGTGLLYCSKVGPFWELLRRLCLCRRRRHFHGVAGADFTFRQHSRIHSAPPRVEFLRDQ